MGMKIDKIPWVIDPHTTAKHEILRRYLQAWMAIVSSMSGVMNYVDGFAGPGEYLNQDGKIVEGSPVLAIKAFLHHKLKDKIKDVSFIFIEKEPKINAYLSKRLAEYITQGVHIDIRNDTFENAINKDLDEIEKKGGRPAPSFCFIDPFGFKGVPLLTIKRIMACERCEVLINFMYEDIERFIGLPQNEENINNLFGEDKEWKQILSITDKTEKYLFLTGLYERQLHNVCGIKYIRTFVMQNKFNKTDYVLFFGTNHILGLQKMKESMWKVDEAGSFTFSDVTYDPRQRLLFEKEPNYALLKKYIINEFKGKSVTIKNLEEFVIVRTPFLPVHIRKPILTPMEAKGEIVVNRGSARKNAYPVGTLITFK